MIYKTIHDVYHNRVEEDEEGNLIEIVVTEIYIDEKRITTVMPQFSNKGVKYNKRMMVRVEGDMYILNHTFKEVTDRLIDKPDKTIGFK